jgi:hypothetical protein
MSNLTTLLGKCYSRGAPPGSIVQFCIEHAMLVHRDIEHACVVQCTEKG